MPGHEEQAPATLKRAMTTNDMYEQQGKGQVSVQSGDAVVVVAGYGIHICIWKRNSFDVLRTRNTER